MLSVLTILPIKEINARIQINYYKMQVTPQNNRSAHMQLKIWFLQFSLCIINHSYVFSTLHWILLEADR